MNISEQALLNTAKQFNITNPLEQAHLLGQCAHESMNFTRLVENLNYSADGLLATFPNRFTTETANAYGRTAEHAANPLQIANIAYNGRMGNAPNSDDGYNFRGRGFIQLTGRDNYTRFNQWVQGKGLSYIISKRINFVTNPDYLAIDIQVASYSAIWFWQTKNIGKFALLNDYNSVTKLINGGLKGLSDRIKLTNNYYQILK